MNVRLRSYRQSDGAAVVEDDGSSQRTRELEQLVWYFLSHDIFVCGVQTHEKPAPTNTNTNALQLEEAREREEALNAQVTLLQSDLSACQAELVGAPGPDALLRDAEQAVAEKEDEDQGKKEDKEVKGKVEAPAADASIEESMDASASLSMAL